MDDNSDDDMDILKSASNSPSPDQLSCDNNNTNNHVLKDAFFPGKYDQPPVTSSPQQQQQQSSAHSVYPIHPDQSHSSLAIGGHVNSYHSNPVSGVHGSLGNGLFSNGLNVLQWYVEMWTVVLKKLRFTPNCILNVSVGSVWILLLKHFRINTRYLSCSRWSWYHSFP